jgi:hypothetical protein
MNDTILGDQALGSADALCAGAIADGANAHVPAGVTAHDETDPFASAHPLNTANLPAALASARKAFTDAGDNAAHAAARAFVVWYYCKSRVATVDMTNAYEEQRKEKNDTIKKHNDKIASDVKAAKQREADRRKQLPQEIHGVNDPERKALLEAELAGLEEKRKAEVATLREDSWVKVAERSAALPFTEEVKFTLDLIKRQQATQVNRYANAVGWVSCTLFGNDELLAQSVPNAAEIAEKIIAEGGVEYVAKKHREARQDEEDAKDRGIIAEAVAAAIKNHVRGMAPIAKVNVEVEAEEGSLVPLIARKAGGKLALLRPLVLGDGEMDDLLEKQFNSDEIPGRPETEFVGEMLAVVTPESIKKAVMTCRDGQALVVSFQKMEEGAPVIRGTPKGDAASILPGHGAVMMETERLAALRKRLGSTLGRKLVKITIATNPGNLVGKCPMGSAFSWQSENSALRAENRSSATMQHEWTSLRHVMEKPYDVPVFEPVVSLVIDRMALVTFSQGKLKEWAEDKSATKSKSVATLSYDGVSSLTLTVSKGPDTVPATAVGEVTADPVQLTVHPKGLADMFTALGKTNATSFTLGLDTYGALRIEWETTHARYAAYLPECHDGRKFVTNRILRMR